MIIINTLIKKLNLGGIHTSYMYFGGKPFISTETLSNISALVLFKDV